jgi:hypothetical protein
MPTMVIDEPVRLECVFSDGSRAQFDLAGGPNAVLARDLAVGLVELIHPHGSVDSQRTVAAYLLALRRLVDRLAEQSFTGGAGQLRRGQLAQFWMAGPAPVEALTRAMVEGFARAGGRLGEGVLELAVGRHFNIQPNRRPLPPYPDTEWQRLSEACRQVVDDSYAAHRGALVSISRGRDPGGGGWTLENFCWLLSRLGPVGTPQVAAALEVSVNVFHDRRPAAFYEAVQAVFPHLDVAIAYRLLFGVYSGIVPDGIDGLGVGDLEWAGDASILLSYVKRRTAAESLNLPNRAVRLLEQWLAHSSLLRGFTPPEDRDRLWLSLARPGNAALAARRISSVSRCRWAESHGVVGDNGKPLRIHRARVRTTYHAMRDKNAWTGNARATIDPNHTAAVEGDHYLSVTTPGQRHAAETIIEDAQHDLLRRAHPPTVISEGDAAVLAEGYPHLLAAMDLDDAAIGELVGGARDVFTAACADQLAGLHGPVGKPCPARPWVCLLCPLAVFAPRHAVNLLRLKAFFSRQWRQMPAAHFMAVFGPYAARIEEILNRFDPVGLAAAAVQVADTDDEVPLRPEELSA